MNERGGLPHLTCFTWCLSMAWYVWKSGSVDNVKATCNGGDHEERPWAQARNQVYVASRARRDVGGARGDWETSDGVVCTSTAVSRADLTCQLTAAWAGSSGSRQEGFQASCNDPDASWTLTSGYEVYMRCWYDYLVCRGSTDAFARRILEGLKDEAIL